MSDGTEFEIGAEVSCTDGVCGDLDRVVVDPLSRTVTHLVVEPKHRKGLGRLVPVALVDEGENGLTLACSTEEFDHLEPAEETHFLPGAGLGGYGPSQTLSWPYYGLAGGGMAGMAGMGGMGLSGLSNGPQAVVRDRVPLGEVEVRKGDPVHASDGNIGRVRGLVVEPIGRHVTHVLLDEGHLWGKKQVALPISSVTAVREGGLEISLSKDEIRDLPPVDIDQDI